MTTAALNLSVKITVTVLVMLIPLGVGFYLRHRLVRRLKNSVLDRWIIETLGFLIILLLLSIGGAITLSVWDNVGSFFSELGTKYNTDLYQISRQLVITTLLITFGIGVARTIQSLALRGLGENHIDINLRTLISRICYFTALTIVGFWTLSIWDIPLGIPATAVGIITVLVSFAVQDILKNLVAGFYMLVERPFFIGDQITVTISPATYVGKVQDIKLRATKLRLVGGEEITIPNMILFGGAVINNTYDSERRVTITATLPEVDFSPDETAARMQKALTEIATIAPKPEPAIQINKYADEKITLLVHFWLESDQTLDVSEAMHILHKLMPSAELTVIEPSGGA